MNRISRSLGGKIGDEQVYSRFSGSRALIYALNEFAIAENIANFL
jgi:hypothetical protein